eukprot:scaffold106588_cov63-Phaeocystis_antarctica.AAC.3
MADVKLVSIKCDIPKTHLPGQKVIWISPITGLKVALNVPDTAKPGQILTFQIPESIVTGIGALPNPRDPAPAPVEPEEPVEKLVTIECDIPKTHLPGQKVIWVSPVTGMKVSLNVPDTAEPGQTLTFQLPERIVTPPAPAPVEPVEPVEPAEPAEKLVTIECDIPKTHLPGQKVVWVSPVTGMKVSLSVPENAEPGQTLTFQLPERIVTPLPASAPADEPAPAVPGTAGNKTPAQNVEQATLEVVIPADWTNGVKLATTMENGQRVIITPPDGAKPGMSLEFNVPASMAEGLPASPQAAAPPQPAPAAPAAPAAPTAPDHQGTGPQQYWPPAVLEAPQEPEAPPARAAAVVERGTEQAAAQAVPSTVKVPASYSKSALSEIYAQKTEAPWVKRASSDKYSMEAVRSKVPVKEVAERV